MRGSPIRWSVLSSPTTLTITEHGGTGVRDVFYFPSRQFRKSLFRNMTFTHEDLLRWHPGELEAREDRGFEIEGGPGGLQPGLIYGSGQFLEQLQLFPLTTLDSEGRPWVSILTSETGQPGFIKSLASEGQGQLGALSLQSIPIPPGTPLLEHVRSGKRLSDPSGDYWEGDRLLTASVGVLLTNRRRNKYEGWIEAAEQNRDGTWNLDLGILASMGNCPKCECPIAVATAQCKLLNEGTPCFPSKISMSARSCRLPQSCAPARTMRLHL